MEDILIPPVAAEPAIVTRLRTRAERRETPCGDGHVVWHVWGQPGAHPLPLILLHGGSGSWTHWLRNIEPLVAAGRQVWVPDLPGFGDSARPDKASDVDDVVHPMQAGLQALLGDQACELVGFSFGALLAGLLTRQYPARTARLVLVGAPSMGLAPLRPFVLQPWRPVTEPLARQAVFRQNLAELMLHDPAAIDGLALWLQASNVVRDRMVRRRRSRLPLLAEAMPHIGCPIHAIYGSEDVLYRGQLPALRAVLQTAGDFRGLEIIEGAGHWVMYEDAERFNAALALALGHALP